MYISNLGFHMTDEDLRSMFQVFGPVVSAEIILDRAGHSRRFGLVKMSSAEDARSAIDTLDGKELEGRHIFVGIARLPENPKARVASEFI